MVYKYRAYTGVGSRKTPPDIIEIIKELAGKLNDADYTLRSGGAVGADTAFENESGGMIEIFHANDVSYAAMEMAAKYHPAWNACNEYAKKLHGRNAFQVLGWALDDPSDFLICWTPDGAESHKERSIKTGGTGTAISIADAYNVPVFNLKNENSLERLNKYLDHIK